MIPILDDLLIISLILTIPLFWIKNQKALALRILFTSGIAWLIAHGIKNLFPTPRPYLVEKLPALVNRPPTDSAFPSGHAATAFAIATTIFFFNKKWGIIAFLIALMVGLMRILGRVHYPIDILGGITIGIIIALIVNKLSRTHSKLNNIPHT
jgi:undecaprenyl-diphosphatase